MKALVTASCSVRLPIWVRVICSQHLQGNIAQKDSHLRTGEGTVVGFMDYVIGRIDGRFLLDVPFGSAHPSVGIQPDLFS